MSSELTLEIKAITGAFADLTVTFDDLREAVQHVLDNEILRQLEGIYLYGERVLYYKNGRHEFHGPFRYCTACKLDRRAQWHTRQRSGMRRR